MYQRITIIKVRHTAEPDVNAMLKWLGSSLGLFGERDKDSSCYRLFVELINSSRKDKGLTSDELAFKLNLSRATVVHHLHKLLAAGIVVREQNVYILRTRKLEQLIEELKHDMVQTYDDLKQIAKKIDDRLGL